MDKQESLIKNPAIGMIVEINPQQDRTRKKLVTGAIAKILSRNLNHPHGILVELEDGTTGRVKKISGGIEINSISTNILTKSAPPETDLDLKPLIDNGENHFVEFKSSILWSVRLSEKQINESNSYEVKRYGRNASKYIIAKSIAGFLNSDGGNLIIGIKENKTANKDEIIGIESEFYKLQDQCVDGYRRMIVDTAIRNYFPSNIFHHFNNYLTINFEQIEGKTVCHIHIKKSDSKVFITSKKNKKYGHFFVRIDATTRELQGEEIVDYCLKRFSKV